MKFKYHYLENKLSRIEDDYLYEISEENRKVEHFFMRGIKISFKLGENHWLVILPEDEFNIKNTVCYTKPLQNGELVHYQKEIKRKFFEPEVETIFEFTEADRAKEETN